ncbi:SDR family NAD(P)-dependent oxidoreductase [Niabella drilacis]|uniref:NADP-dependent 3-hydroxy acid dehydrogenase YdfG n=1 Tax=Niabella drilacis (strain DSM 25811 / CCM 8410 / CCUG 62505 / LMG 26954 / E90) TaxID=1285928 RepID=A0A1G6T1W1_NIADE|nr:SDR family NAD(P)-dependent oxidoreductase [Niabella drilacis]SDD23009.1 NADP-dependent 3-hydroxy acid dehydrogenase YdfG [Niabella drilacis]
MNKTVFITGATAGFGEACAKKFAANHYNVIITGRRKERLEQLAESLATAHAVEVLPLTFDVRDRGQVAASISTLPDAWKRIDVLINNAGLAAGKDDFDKASLDDWDTMVDTNLKGFAYVAQAISRLMIPHKRGHIINLGSVAAKQVYSQGNMYCATKHAVDALSRAMRIDLLPHHIKVTAIHPGAADTEFSMVRFKGNRIVADKVYDGLIPLVAADVAETIFYCTTLPDHVCINDLVISCTQQADCFYYDRE